MSYICHFHTSVLLRFVLICLPLHCPHSSSTLLSCSVSFLTPKVLSFLFFFYPPWSLPLSVPFSSFLYLLSHHEFHHPIFFTPFALLKDFFLPSTGLSTFIMGTSSCTLMEHIYTLTLIKPSHMTPCFSEHTKAHHFLKLKPN